MTDSLTGYFTVGIADLSRGLRAVLPHVSTDETFPTLCAMRLDRGPVNLTLAATDSRTAALALVDVVDWGDDPSDGTLGAFDLTVEDVKKILTLFKPPKENPEEAVVRFDVDADSVTITDTSGLFPTGQSLRLPALSPAGDFPDLYGLFGKTIREPAVGAARLVTNHDFPRRFTEAGKAYGGAAIVLEPTGATTAIVVRVREEFIGLWMPIRTTEDIDIELRQWSDAWMERLPAPSGDKTLAEAVKDLQDMGVTIEVKTADKDFTDDLKPGPFDRPLIDEDRQELLEQAATLVVTTQFASASMLQRKMRIGFAKAREMLVLLEALGVVGPNLDGKVRDVLVALDGLDAVVADIKAGKPTGDPQVAAEGDA